jgi:hypothetical protein
MIMMTLGGERIWCTALACMRKPPSPPFSIAACVNHGGTMTTLMMACLRPWLVAQGPLELGAPAVAAPPAAVDDAELLLRLLLRRATEHTTALRGGEMRWRKKRCLWGVYVDVGRRLRLVAGASTSGAG